MSFLSGAPTPKENTGSPPEFRDIMYTVEFLGVCVTISILENLL